MKTLDQQMAVYAAYHRNRWNRLTHFIGVPAIIFAILIPMNWLSFGEGVTLAHVFVGVVLAYYFLLDVPLALATTVAVAALLLAAKAVAGTGVASGWIWFGVFFVGGWVFQLVGHVFEGRRPALSDNLFQIFIAPIFLVAEVFFALGLKRDVLRKIEDRLAG
ncbi:MAG TPA: Mpo1-like protein [Burkholderiales bacterium]|nr:Mpo1-like protein [Burkholderiales bacterium]